MQFSQSIISVPDMFSWNMIMRSNMRRPAYLIVKWSSWSPSWAVSYVDTSCIQGEVRENQMKCFYFVWHMRNLMYMYMFSVYLESWSIIVKGGPQNITSSSIRFHIRVIAPKIWVAPIINLLWNALKYLKRGKLFLFPMKSSYKK